MPAPKMPHNVRQVAEVAIAISLADRRRCKGHATFFRGVKFA